MVNVNEFVQEYFNRGYDYSEILATLRQLHNKILSLRQLHRILRSLGLFRRKHGRNTREVIAFIQNELRGSGSLLGYRLMHQRCIQQGYHTTRENVRLIIKYLDPVGVERRTRRVLRRRQYWSYGPNWVWHIDGYDKLKPFGFSIHGAIDGFSRRILWLQIVPSNKDPGIICKLYLNFAQRIGGIPRKIVGDRGTENVYVAAGQRFMRRNHQDTSSGERSFKYGRSVTNQRIEAWWSILRKTCTNFWINFFKDLIDQDFFDTSSNIHCECIKFCFYPVIKNDLDQSMSSWNNHRIRFSSTSDRRVRPAGRPNILYFTPSMSHAEIQDYKLNFNQNDMDIMKDVCSKDFSEDFICSKEAFELCNIIMLENGLQIPNDSE
eukprot:TCONS_00041804-protein